MTRRARALAVAVLVLGLAAAGCAPPAERIDPVVPRHPLALRSPSGWTEVPVAGPAGSAGPRTDPNGESVIFRAEPGDGSASLSATVFPGRVATIETGVSLAEAGREMRWQDYASEPAEAIEVPGADAGRRVDYRYTCADTDDACTGTVFVLLRERDAYLVRLSRRDGTGSDQVADDLQATLALTD